MEQGGHIFDGFLLGGVFVELEILEVGPLLCSRALDVGLSGRFLGWHICGKVREKVEDGWQRCNVIDIKAQAIVYMRPAVKNKTYHQWQLREGHVWP